MKKIGKIFENNHNTKHELEHEQKLLIPRFDILSRIFKYNATFLTSIRRIREITIKLWRKPKTKQWTRKENDDNAFRPSPYTCRGKLPKKSDEHTPIFLLKQIRTLSSHFAMIYWYNWSDFFVEKSRGSCASRTNMVNA